MQKAKLKDIAQITTGLTVRGRLQPTQEGNAFILQMKDFADKTHIDTKTLTKIEVKNLRDAHIIKDKDIIFRSRGQDNTVAIYDGTLKNAVLASPLLRVRTSSGTSVLPEYLYWFINQPKSQAYLTSRAKGSTVQMVSKNALAELEVDLPPLPQQKKIAELYMLSLEEQKLMQEIMQKKKKHIHGLLMQAASGSVSCPNKETHSQKKKD